MILRWPSIRGKSGRRVFHPEGPRSSEWWNGATAMAWGTWLALPWLDSFTTTTAFRQLAMLAPETFWASLVFGVGLAQVVAVTRKRMVWRMVTNFALTFLWLFMAWLFFGSNAASTAGILHLMLGLRQASLLQQAVLDWRFERWWTVS